MRAWRLAGAVAGAVVVMDQAVKQIVVSSVERESHTRFFIGIDLTYTRNRGVAFGALGGGGTVVTVLTIAALLFALSRPTPSVATFASSSWCRPQPIQLCVAVATCSNDPLRTPRPIS